MVNGLDKEQLFVACRQSSTFLAQRFVLSYSVLVPCFSHVLVQPALCFHCLTVTMGKVTMAKVAPRKSTITQKSSSPKVPKAADLSDAKVGSGKGKSVADDKVHIYQVPFCDDGLVYGEGFIGTMVALHLLHEYPSVWFLFLQALGAYCEFRHATDETFPKSWRELLDCMRMKIVTTSPSKWKTTVDDEDGVGTLVKNRVAIYCDLANVKNIYCFLDGFVAWRVVTQLNDNDSEFNQNPEIVIHVPADSLLQFEKGDGMECTVQIEKDMAEAQVNAVQALPPVWPPRFVIATISSESECTISIVFSGNTLPFAEGFDAQGIGKKKIKLEDARYAEWYRVYRGLNLTEVTKKDWLLKVFGNLVLKNSPCFVRVETWPTKDSAFNVFFSELEALPGVRRWNMP